MKITKITYYNIKKDADMGFLARCSVVLDDSVVVHDIKVCKGCKGKYIVMPERKERNPRVNLNKEIDDVFHPVRQSFSAYMTALILKGYELYKDSGNIVFIP